MTTQSRPVAHGLSLGLFDFIEKMDGIAVRVVVHDLGEYIAKLKLTEDLDVVILIEDAGPHVVIEHTTPFGEIVIEELRSRSQFPPCAEGEHEMRSGICRWCGHKG